MPNDSLPNSHPAYCLSTKAANALRRGLAASKKEIEAGERNWKIASLDVEPGSSAAAALQEISAASAAAAAVTFFADNNGNLAHVEKTLSRRYATLLDPRSGKLLKTQKTLVVRKYQFSFFSFRNEPLVLASIGSRPAWIFYLNDKIAIAWNDKENPYTILNQLIKTVRTAGSLFYRYIQDNRPARVACIIGDERPTHYIRESLGSLQRLADSNRLSKFFDHLDYLIIPTDYAFIPADELFSIPGSTPVILTPLSELNTLAMDRNIFVQRLMRSGHNMTEALRQRILDHAERTSAILTWPPAEKIISKPGHVKVWFSVEIEKGRIQNQSEVFQELTSFLSSRFPGQFQMIVDGWSPMPLALSPKDKTIARQIRDFIRDQTATSETHFDVVPAYELPYRDKLKLCSEVDFFVSMQGAAALVPSGLSHKPGIAYHNTWGLSSTLEVWTENLHQVKARKETLPPGQHAGRATFEVDIQLFRETLETLAAEIQLGHGGSVG